MNHRMLFFLSVIVTAVGIIGIIWQEKPSGPAIQSPHEVKSAKHIIIAQAARELNPYELLKKQDYQLKTIVIDSDSDPRDVSSLNNGNLYGYLIKSNIKQGDFILPAAVESPKSPSFPVHSLKRNEAPFTYIVKAAEEYLLSSLSAGDDVSIFIRLVEVDKRNITGLIQEGESNGASQKALKNYIIQKLMGPVTVINVINNNKSNKKSYNSNEPAGTIVLRVSGQQLSELKAVERSGEILLFPFNDEEVEQTRMDEVLPQFSAMFAENAAEAWTPIKQLRGKE